MLCRKLSRSMTNMKKEHVCVMSFKSVSVKCLKFAKLWEVYCVIQSSQKCFDFIGLHM